MRKPATFGFTFFICTNRDFCYNFSVSKKGFYMVRKIARDIIVRYLQENCYVSVVLHEQLKNSPLSRKDKDLLTQIVYGTVQNKIYIAYQLEKYIVNKKVNIEMQAILYTAVYQICFLDAIPSYAIVHEAVSLCPNSYAGKFVNAILRRFLQDGKRPIKEDNWMQQVSITTSHPLWMVQMLHKQYGKEVTEKICVSNNQPPLRSARVNTLKTTKDRLIETGDFTVGQVSLDALLYRAGNIASTDYFKQGLVTVQDESSQLVAPFLAPKKGQRILDMCCAPGGKTTHLSALMENTGEIIACDVSDRKLEKVAENASRLGITNITLQVCDATQASSIFDMQSFDAILLDAPCSGLGVLKRKPEIKYHDSDVMNALIPLQSKLLENAYYLLKNNGKLVYSTCTLNKKENSMQIHKFIERHPDMRVIEERTILPYIYHSDGFYMCKLQRIG